MILRNYDIVYFIGIGGIGMSALARWCLTSGMTVYGYDRVESDITRQLEEEGASIHFSDDPDLIPRDVKTKDGKSLIVYTPAIPEDHKELNFLRLHSYTIMKRAEVLGRISKGGYTVAVAGTHGKTTTSTMITHILKHAGVNITAFLGGIATNYSSNFVVTKNDGEPVYVMEADEFDRSFLHLAVDYAVVTSMDSDHLDTYGNSDELIKSFKQFLGSVTETCLINSQVAKYLDPSPNYRLYGLSGNGSRGQNIKIKDGYFTFDFSDSRIKIDQIRLLQPGYHNVENAVAAIKACLDLGVSENEIMEALKSYQGVKRRFEYIIKTDHLVFVDDYAHHPVEIDALLTSLADLFPEKKLTAIFQPHLYSRTRDFADEFARSLSRADEVLLLDIYPAREEMIQGVSSELIFDKIQSKVKKRVTMTTLESEIDPGTMEVVVTMGAGDIDTLVEPIKQKLRIG